MDILSSPVGVVCFAIASPVTSLRCRP
jgi:hypothetical protein